MAVAFEMCSSKHSKYFKDTTTNLVINHYYTSQAFVLLGGMVLRIHLRFTVLAMASHSNIYIYL